MALDLWLLAVALDRFQADDSRHVKRRRQVVDNRVQQRLHALVLERRAAQDGSQLRRERGFADRRLEDVLGNLGLLEDQLQQCVVVMGDLLQEVFASSLGRFQQRLGDLHDFLLGAELVFVDDRLHPDEIDDTREIALSADRQLDRDGVGAESVDHRLHALLEVGAGAIHLVDVGDARHVILVGLAPDGLRLRLHAGDRVEQRDRAVEHAQGALDLDGEVDVARACR